MKNILTFDLEFWYNSEFIKYDNKEDYREKILLEKPIFKILRLLDKHKIKATFFVTGEIAKLHPSSIRKIHEDGHEVACHGLTHDKNEFLLDESDQRRRIEEATEIIEKIVGARPLGFRAPCLRANSTTLKILEEYGYIYDSSVIPTFIPGYYGVLSAPTRPYHPSPLRMDRELSLIHI